MNIMNVVTSLIGLSTAVAIIYLVRKDHLHVRYGLVWSVVAVVFAVLGFFPGIFDRIGQAVHGRFHGHLGTLAQQAKRIGDQQHHARAQPGLVLVD